MFAEIWEKSILSWMRWFIWRRRKNTIRMVSLVFFLVYARFGCHIYTHASLPQSNPTKTMASSKHCGWMRNFRLNYWEREHNEPRCGEEYWLLDNLNSIQSMGCSIRKICEDQLRKKIKKSCPFSTMVRNLSSAFIHRLASEAFSSPSLQGTSCH